MPIGDFFVGFNRNIPKITGKQTVSKNFYELSPCCSNPFSTGSNLACAELK